MTPMILVVDPDPDVRELCVTGFMQSGWLADSVVDGREALAKAIVQRPAAIVTEARVPCLDGLELCRLLRRDPETHGIVIVMLTSATGNEQIARAKSAGADVVLVKPCAPDVLVRTVQTILGEGRSRAAAQDAAPAALPPRTRALSHRHQRRQTASPPLKPPALVCPQCDTPLVYERSHIGGVNATHGEQWDYFACPTGCGDFQYRQRTRKLRHVA
jgi:DNA-binding response OmpR family regulator